jgi:hypothetical protein
VRNPNFKFLRPANLFPNQEKLKLRPSLKFRLRLKLRLRLNLMLKLRLNLKPKLCSNFCM